MCKACGSFVVDREASCRRCGGAIEGRASSQPARAEGDPAKLVASLEAMRLQGRELLDRLQQQHRRLAAAAAPYRDLPAQWEARAYAAVKAGDDALAREALFRQREMQTLVDEQQRQLVAIEADIVRCDEALAGIEKRIAEAGRRQALLRANKARAAARAQIEATLAQQRAAASSQGPLSSLALEPNPSLLLDDRLSVRLPEGARTAQRRVGGLMGMAISARRELQVGVAASASGELSRMVFELIDPFAYANNEREAMAAARASALTSQIGVPFAVSTPSPEVSLFEAQSLEQGRADLLVAEALVQHPDRTVLLARFYTDKATAARGAGDVLGCARNVAGSIAPGPRALSVGARLQAFGPPAAADLLAVELPAGFAFDTDRGADFAVHTFSYVVPFGVDPLVLKVYLGGHPSRRYADAPAEVRRGNERGWVLGGEVSWSLFFDEDIVLQEVIAKVPGGGAPLFLHAFGSATSPEQARYVRDMVAAIKPLG